MIYTVLAIVVLLLGYVAFFLLYRQNAARRLGAFSACLLLSNALAFFGMSERTWASAFLLISFDGLASALTWSLGNRALRKWQRTLRFGLWILVAVFFSRLWLIDKTQGLAANTFALTAIVNALQSFSYFTLGADYSVVLQAGLSGNAAWFYYVLTTALAVLAPFTSATFLFEAATKLFARVRAGRKKGKKKYIFSELNEESLALAKSVYASHKRQKEPCSILFADAYRLDNKQLPALRAKAMEIGAICLEDGVSALRYRVDKKGELIYFLIHRDEWTNLDLLLSLTQESDEGMRAYWKSVKQVSLYVFSHNDEADVIAKGIYVKSVKQGKDNLVVKVVRDATNLAYKLLQDKPLFLPLESVPVGAENERVSVAILGGGKIGREFFSTAYWCGQMLNRQGAKMPFSISVFAADAKALEEKLRFEMPEIFADGEKASKKGAWRYCSLAFYGVEFGTQAFENAFENCADCTYALVAMGDDELNFRAATWLGRRLDRAYAASQIRPVVNFVLESEDLYALLKKRYVDDTARPCIMNPFGCLAERYDFTENIQRNDLEDAGWRMNVRYQRSRDVKSVYAGVTDEEIAKEVGCACPAPFISETDERSKPTNAYLSDGYSRRSSMASALHGAYKHFASAGERELMGVEHCRWNAFTRTNGYRLPSAQEFLSFCVDDEGFQTRSHLQKLHACLVECDYADYTYNFKLWAYFHLAVEKKTQFVYPELPKKAAGTVETFVKEWREAFFRMNEKTLKNYPLLNASVEKFDALDDLAFFVFATRMQRYQENPTQENLKSFQKCADTKVNDRNAVLSALL